MNNRRTMTAFLALSLISTNLIASELPRLPKDLDPQKQFYGEQPKLLDLTEAYVSTSPEDLKDGLQVGKMNLPGTEQAVKALLEEWNQKFPGMKRNMLASLSALRPEYLMDKDFWK